MIQEIINYTKYLKENSPKVFEEGLEPSKGLHIFVELDNEGNAINFPGEKGVDWDYYDGKKKSSFIKKIIPYDLSSSYVTMNKQKKFDPKQKIHSASPFALSFNFNFSDNDKRTYGIEKAPKSKMKNNRLIKRKRVEIVKGRLEEYFKNVEKVFELDEETQKWVILFQEFLMFKMEQQISRRPNMFVEINRYWAKLKEKEYCKVYLKNIDLNEYESVYTPYLNANIFNKDKYNINGDTDILGVIDYYTTFADGKLFLKHKTALFKDGISNRFTGEAAKFLNDFSNLRKLFPNPLPLFIDKNEFSNTDEIIRILRQEKGRFTYSQILKQIFKNTPDKVLQNYYLLFFNGMKIEDFDFVSKFRYSLKENDRYPTIRNLFNIKIDKEDLKRDVDVRNIFFFESEIVKTIFNNSLVKRKDDSYTVDYFGEIKAERVSGGEPVYQMILKYRKAFYDYIYKSKTQAISCTMWDEIMWNSTIGDLRNTNFDKKYFIEQSIKEKLNIWFSLYNYFTNNKKRTDMASKIPELLEKMKKVANDENTHFETTDEFAFGAGQVIRKILDKSEAGERTHALLEPFLQKTNTKQFNLAIARAFETYKHGFKLYRGDTRYPFDKILSEVMGFSTEENLKTFLPMILAGYFAKSTFDKENDSTDNRNN